MTVGDLRAGGGCWQGRVGVRTVQLSSKSTAEIVQVIGQSRVINGVGSSKLVVGDLPEPSPDRSRLVGRELVLYLLSTAV